MASSPTKIFDPPELVCQMQDSLICLITTKGVIQSSLSLLVERWGCGFVFTTAKLDSWDWSELQFSCGVLELFLTDIEFS